MCDIAHSAPFRSALPNFEPTVTKFVLNDKHPSFKYHSRYTWRNTQTQIKIIHHRSFDRSFCSTEEIKSAISRVADTGHTGRQSTDCRVILVDAKANEGISSRQKMCLHDEPITCMISRKWSHNFFFHHIAFLKIIILKKEIQSLLIRTLICL